MCCQACLGIGSGCNNPTGAEWPVLHLAQTSHYCICIQDMTEDKSPGQKKCLLSLGGLDSKVTTQGRIMVLLELVPQITRLQCRVCPYNTTIPFEVHTLERQLH